MKSDIKIGIIGGDLRQLVAAAEIAEKGYETAVFGFDSFEGPLGMVTRCVSVEDTVRRADIVVLPLPYSVDKIHLNMPLSKNEIHTDKLFSLFNEDQTVAGGKFDPEIKKLAESAGVKLIDYYDREDLIVYNAISTSEGAINIAMQELTMTLGNSKVLIMGFGRIGKILANKLYGLHAEISIAARKEEDFAWITAYGYKGVRYKELDAHIGEYNLVFNTVPTLLLNKERLEKINKNTVIIDLASNPGGVDFTAAKNLGLNVIWALSLPGKYAPVTSGRTLASVLESIMKEEGIVEK